MSVLSNESLAHDGVERRYDTTSDRLFLVYYALPPGLNSNKWGVSPTSYEANIRTAINKPVIIYRKEPANKWHTHQAGNFVHPTMEQATEEFGHEPTESEYYQWQEKWAVGRIRNVEQRKDKGYAWTLEITDQAAKAILKEDKYTKGIPGWTSPQIITYPNVFPKETATQNFDHWVVSHVILTDEPAYGYDKSAIQGKCLGAEKECLIKTKSASSENVGFCIKEALTQLIESHSSLASYNANLSSNMSTEQPQPPSTNSEVVVTKTLSEQNPKQESEGPSSSEGPTEQERSDQERSQRPEEEADRVANLPKSIEESHKEILQLREQNKSKDEMLRSVNKEMKKIIAWKDQIETERRDYMLRSVIPRQLFKSEQSYSEEIKKITNLGLDKDLDWLKDHYSLMSTAKMAQEQTDLKPQIKVKSASHEVPDYQDQKQTGANNDSSLVQKTLDLQRKMLGGHI